MKYIYKIFNFGVGFIIGILMGVFGKFVSDVSYTNIALFLAYFPLEMGEKVRFFFYKYTLNIGTKVKFKFGSVCLYRNITIGNNVTVGLFNQIGECEINDNILMGANIVILSGKKQHHFFKRNKILEITSGERNKIKIGSNCWIGNNSLIMNDLASNCIVAAGSVILHETKEFNVYAGNPASIKKEIT